MRGRVGGGAHRSSSKDPSEETWWDKNYKTVFIVVGVLILLIALSPGIYFLFKKNPKGSDSGGSKSMEPFKEAIEPFQSS